MHQQVRTLAVRVVRDHDAVALAAVDLLEDLERLGAARENPFMTTCGVIATFRAAAEAANLLHTDSGLRENWMTLAEKLTQTLPQNDHTYLPYPG